MFLTFIFLDFQHFEMYKHQIHKNHPVFSDNLRYIDVSMKINGFGKKDMFTNPEIMKLIGFGFPYDQIRKL